MFEFLLGLSFWPVVMLLFLLVIGGAATARGEPWLMTLGLAVWSVVAYFLLDINVLDVFIERPIVVVFGSLGYAALGLLWSMFKWRQHLLSDAVQASVKRTREKAERLDAEEYVNYEVDPASNRDRIVSWITLWPFSVLGYVLGDMLRNLGNWLYSLLGGVYQRMSDRHTK